MSPNDYPDAIYDLGLAGADPIDAPAPLRCGCVTADLYHDEADCLEAQADALAWAEEKTKMTRREAAALYVASNWRVRGRLPRLSALADVLAADEQKSLPWVTTKYISLSCTCGYGNGQPHAPNTFCWTR